MKRKKTTIIIVMCVAMLFMAVGYALLSTRLNINGSTAVTSSWKVEFTDIRTTNYKGGATNSKNPSITSTSASFDVNLVQPGDEITYEIDITNFGDIVAEIKGATYSIEGSEAIYVAIEGIRKGTQIESCENLNICPTITMIIKVGYDPAVEKDPVNKEKTIDLTLDIGQYVPSNPTPDGELAPELVAPSYDDEDDGIPGEGSTLVEHILYNSPSQNGLALNYQQTSYSSGTNGLYTGADDLGTTYFFRGNVLNNYVTLGSTYIPAHSYICLYGICEGEDSYKYSSLEACYSDVDAGAPWAKSDCVEIYQPEQDIDYVWRIVRINGDGTIRLVFDTTYVDKGVTYYSNVGNVKFNNYATDPKYLGYTYSDGNGGQQDSNVKTFLDTWYENNLYDDYHDYIADGIFCNDRTIADGISKQGIYYGAYKRLHMTGTPTFFCANQEDRYTVNSSLGNGYLDYPIALLTADEVSFAGAVQGINSEYFSGGSNTSYYLYNADIGSSTTMSPWYITSSYSDARVWIFNDDLDHGIVNGGYAIRPVINLKANVLWKSGNGTSADPYVIVTD